MDLEHRYGKNPDFVFRRIGDELLLLPIRQNMGSLESVYALNEVAARVWEWLDGQLSVGAIRDRIVAEFDVDPATAAADLAELLGQLRSIGALDGGLP